ncbi:MAG: choice-of-anchor B family protein [Fimbriimonadaceae bacterium]|nr:choice-of-anchor B family protein [Fimbriimonadaceae bacterium]
MKVSFCVLALTLSTSVVLAHGGEEGSDQAGSDGPFPSQNVQLRAHLNFEALGHPGATGNVVEGWRDPSTGREYALMGLSNGTVFVDITNADNPDVLGYLPSHTGNSLWRDIKVYQNRAYVVSDNNGAHGMQVFDLTQLRGLDRNLSRTFAETAHYGGVTRGHTISVNEQTGYAIISGSNRDNGGLHVVDIRDPSSPTYLTKAGGFSSDGYTHEAQSWVYQGPDSTYTGLEIGFAANEDTLTVVNMSNMAGMTQISRTGYSGAGYTHQGWLTEDHRYWIFNDELDERNAGEGSFVKTHVFNVEDLDNPRYVGFYQHDTVSIDHNVYIVGEYAYMSNYSTGLRIMHIHDPENLVFHQTGFIDTYPAGDTSMQFVGSWDNYPFLSQHKILVSDINSGLFIVRATTVPEPATMIGLGALGLVALRRRKAK